MSFSIQLIELVIAVVIFIFLMFAGIVIYKKLKKPTNRLLNAEEYFPKEEVHSLKQIS